MSSHTIDTIIKVSGTVAALATSNDVASVDIPEDGEILSLGAAIYGDYSPSPGAGANRTLAIASELSFLSTNQIGTNDARGAIGGISCAAVFFAFEGTETGGAGSKLSEIASINPVGGISVNAGERIHLHTYSNASGLTGTTTYYLYLNTRGGGRRAPKRR